ncbi:MAG: gamma-glutamyl-gamma-aminobutyrate hydrolase family protein [Maledivibacter sp.]|jgi:putative glutamine amidotransferase|nr:gamma-glutamyl-gamma-aminobutyrate hydrolase family protein [Maledivibacter sp.]
MKKTVIGIVGNTLKTITEISGEIERAYVNRSYVRAVERAGGIPIIIPCTGNVKIIEAQVSLCDGFLFTGGEDIDPNQYGEGPCLKLGPIKPELDMFQLTFFKIVQKLDKPILGICRGLQVINTGLGGTLFQDIECQCKDVYQHFQTGGRSHSVHKIQLSEGSVLKNIFQSVNLSVNSLHHQSVKKLGKGLKVCAGSEDGIIEAIESDMGKKIIGVQWHPEEMIDSTPEMNKLFDWLIKESSFKPSFIK